jgi:transcriptional regulator with XRE-family HTH domain
MQKRTLPYKKVMAARMKKIRKSLGIVQKDLAGQLGFSTTTISTIESEMQLPTVPIIISMINKYRVSPLWLLKGEGDMFIKDKEPELSRLDHFKKAFPDVPADAEVFKMIESLSVPILKNALILKFFELKDVYKSQIQEYQKENNKNVSRGKESIIKRQRLL